MDKKLIKDYAEKIKQAAAQLKKPINIMEVCGTHTMAISRFGIRDMLPENITLISGPGCPVCVTPIKDVDRAVEISKNKDVIITTFGDMMRVPGTKTTLSAQKAHGADVRIVYSPIDALDICEKNPDKQVVFIGIGFETTSPSIALTVLEAMERGIKNFFVLPYFKVIIPPMEALLSDKELNIHGFLAPGHASTIVGGKTYEYITKKYGEIQVLKWRRSYKTRPPQKLIRMIVDIHKSVYRLTLSKYMYQTPGPEPNCPYYDLQKYCVFLHPDIGHGVTYQKRSHAGLRGNQLH